MEVVQDVTNHTASLLTSLNLQREQAQFCDCVVRQGQSPGQLYPAHRCVLAASSPVLASILSSTGALVELHAPCLSGSVLALLLDYIYTGVLPCARTQQQYYSLLTAARYLQMDKLQEALCAWQQTDVNNPDKTNTSMGTENQPHKNIISTHSKTADTFKNYLPLTCSIDACRRPEEADTYSVQSAASSGGANSITGADCCSTKDLSTSSTASSENTGNYRQVTHRTSQDLIQNIPSTTEGYDVSRVDKDVPKDQFHSAGTVKPETWQKNTEEELVRTVEGTRSSSSSSSLLPPPCCGAVPVICHSSRAAMIQLAEVSTMPMYHPVSQASVNSSRTPASQSSTENESTVEDITTKHKNYYGLENLDYRNKQDVYYKSNTDQSDMLKQDYTCTNTDHFIKLIDEHVESGLSCIHHHNDYHSDSFQNTNHTTNLRDNSVPLNKVCSSFISGLKYKTDLSFDDLPSKHQRLDLSDCHDVSMSATEEEQSQDLTVVVPFPVDDSGSDSHCEDVCPEGEVKEEHSYYSKCPADMDRYNHYCNLYRPKTDWYLQLHRAETSTKDAASSDSDNRDTTVEDKRHRANVCLTVSNAPESNLDNVTGRLVERHTSLDLEKISDTETSEPQSTLTIPVDSNMSDSMYSAVGPSYHGHVHYHCLPQEDTHLSHEDSDHKHSRPSYPGHSDQFSDDEEAATFASPDHSPLRQHFATGTTDQVLLLDISTKHAELLVSYKHRADRQKRGVAFNKTDSFGTGSENNDREQRNEETSAAGVDKRKIRVKTKFGAECFGEDRYKSWVRETNAEERKPVGREQSRSVPKNKARLLGEVSKHEKCENQTSTLTVCSAPSVPDSVRASMSSSLSVCIPPTLPASMSTNISAHLSAPAFQCSLCDRSFSQRGSLNRHVRSHLGVRPFPCPRCPMTFSRQYRVIEHMRVHQRCTLGNDFPKPPASSI